VPRDAPRGKTVPAPPKLGSFPDAVTRRTLADEDEWSGDLVTGVELNGVVAEHTRLRGCELRDVKLTGAELHRCVITDVRFVDCELSGAMITESSWLRVELRNCRMSGLVVSQSQLRDVRFTEGKLDGGDFRMTRLERVVFDSCAMPDADFYEAALTHVLFDSCDLRRAHVSAVKPDGVRLHESDLEGIRGALALRGAVVTPEQVLPLALGVFAEMGITIEHDEPPS
jgi:uncharacterized protein YjbI with pentapeptide repeats